MDEQPDPPSPDAANRTGAPSATSPAAEVVAWAQRRWRRLVGLAAVAAASFTVVVTVGSDDHESIQVVDTGFSTVDEGSAEVTYGVVVENTTADVAYHTVACVGLRMDSDDEDDERGCQRFTIEVLLPGQRVGFGGLGTVLSSPEAEVSGISVELQGPATWEDPDEDRWAEIVADNLEVAYSPENHPVVSFDRESGYPFDVVRNATAYAVFRNDRNEIIGANGTDLLVPVNPREQVRHSILTETSLPGIATAEVYVFPSGI
ncbi:MAG: hypothetical protein ACRD2C_05185 [Acidimicrobiales bacterium]